MSKVGRNLLCIFAINLTTLIFFVLDRLFKILVLAGWQTRLVTLTYNQGMAFGLRFLNPDILAAVIMVILILLIFSLIRLYQKQLSRSCYIAGLTLIIFGAFGNLWDRLQYGQVIDYLNLGFWPVFNLADAMIVAGGGAVFCGAIFYNKQKKKTNKQKPNTNKKPIINNQEIYFGYFQLFFFCLFFLYFLFF
jgi:signal peptidase II